MEGQDFQTGDGATSSLAPPEHKLQDGAKSCPGSGDGSSQESQGQESELPLPSPDGNAQPLSGAKTETVQPLSEAKTETVQPHSGVKTETVQPHSGTKTGKARAQSAAEERAARPSSGARTGSPRNADRTQSAGSQISGQGARPRVQTRSAVHQRAESQEEDGDSDSDTDLSALMEMMALEPGRGRPSSVTGTAFLYGEVMARHKNEWDANYPENPGRLTAPLARCRQLGLLERCVTPQLTYAGEDVILTQHSHHHLQLAKSTATKSVSKLRKLSAKYDSVYFNQATFEAALAAVGCSLELVDQIVQKKVRNGFAMIRPPGHHAMQEEFCGYCVFNNVALAADHALNDLGLERVLIVDWDVHHGQGTQYAFYEDPRVLYFSIHRYEWGKFWPNLRQSDYDFIGAGKGKGFNVNVPLNEVNMTDSDYLAILQQLLMPMAYEFCPQLVLISAGFDAALGCPEGEMQVTPVAYAHFTHMLSTLCEGRLAVLLEGGYCLQSLAEGCALTLRCLLGDPCPPLPPTTEPRDSVVESILNVIKVHRPHWRCFQYQTTLTYAELSPFPAVNTVPPQPGVKFMTKSNRPKTFEEGDYPHPDPALTAALKAQIAELISLTPLAVSPHRVCYVFDAEMRAHEMQKCSHPECPDRISRIYSLHQEWGLLSRCLKVESRLATKEEICAIHSPEYFDELSDTPTWPHERLVAKQRQYNSIYMCTETFNSALLSAGSILSVVDAVLTNQAQSGVAIVRPPGHHAEVDRCMGFCFFNNAAVAARYAQKEFGLKRILILDWDIHHGNGTQHQFYDDASVLYISLHRFDHGFFYPSKPDADFTFVGEQEGEGFNVNIPFSSHPMGDPEYVAAFQQVVMPIAYEFSPELVLVSAGFDAAYGDPLGSYRVTPVGFGHMTRMLSSLANGRLILMLEGGYNLDSISLSMATCTSVLLGDQCPPMGPVDPHPSAVIAICNVLDTQKKYWKSLKCRADLPPVDVTSGAEPFRAAKQEDTSRLTERVGSLSVKEEAEEGGKKARKDGMEREASEAEQSQQCSSDQEAAGAEGGAQASSQASGGTTVEEFLGLKGVEQMFTVTPLPWCPHLTAVTSPPRPLDVRQPCAQCRDPSENWTCLTCYTVLCSRYVQEHMLFHGVETGHVMALSFSDLSVWCYACDSYVHNEKLSPAKASAYLSKFGEPMPGL